MAKSAMSSKSIRGPMKPRSRELALALPKIKAYTDGHAIKKVIVVKDRIINIVVA
jgi:leucyl-tRNA synthetase